MSERVGLIGVFDLSGWSPNVSKYISDMANVKNAVWPFIEAMGLAILTLWTPLTHDLG